MREADIMRDRPKERNSVPEDHRHTRDDHALNKPGREKALNGQAPVDIEMPHPPRGEPLDDLVRGGGHHRAHGAGRCLKACGIRTEHDDRLRPVGPFGKCEDSLKCLAANHQRVDGGHELGVAVGLAAALWQLEAAMRDRIHKEGQDRVLFEIEQPLVPILAEMEETGIKADPEFFVEYSKSLDVEIQKAAAKVYEMAGQEFSIGSPKQLGEVLFEKLGILTEKKSKTGYATGAESIGHAAARSTIRSPCGEVLPGRTERESHRPTYSRALGNSGSETDVTTLASHSIITTGRTGGDRDGSTEAAGAGRGDVGRSRGRARSRTALHGHARHSG